MRLSHLRDRASEKGRRKEYPLFVQLMHSSIIILNMQVASCYHMSYFLKTLPFWLIQRTLNQISAMRIGDLNTLSLKRQKLVSKLNHLLCHIQCY